MVDDVDVINHFKITTENNHKNKQKINFYILFPNEEEFLNELNTYIFLYIS